MSIDSGTLPRFWGIPYWVIPICSGLAWFITIASIFFTWIAKGSPHYPEMWTQQHLAYISNAGASHWGRPILVSGTIITTILFSITFVAERCLRQRNQLCHCNSKTSTMSWAVGAVLTVIAAVALILFPIFCIRGHQFMHYSTVAIFAVGYILAATVNCIEKHQICQVCPSNRLLRHSLHIKMFFIIVEVLFVVLGSVTMYMEMYQSSVVIEWVAALLFSFYMASFAIDFIAVPEEEQEKRAEFVFPMISDDKAGIKGPRRTYMAGQRGYLEIV